jgi:hypothetical protein
MWQEMTNFLSIRFGCLLATYVLVMESPSYVIHKLIGITSQSHNKAAIGITLGRHSNKALFHYSCYSQISHGK